LIFLFLVRALNSPLSAAGSADISKAKELKAKELKAKAGSQHGVADHQEDGQGESSQWEMPSIRGAVLDGALVKEVVSGLSKLVVDGPLAEADAYADLSVYGLANPELKTVVHEKSGRDTEIAFGKKNQYLSKRYVKISGRSGIYLADEAAFEVLNKSSSDVRSKKPFKFASSDLRQLELKTSKGVVGLDQPVVGEWRILEPEQYRASLEDVQEFIGTLNGVTVSEFIDGESGDRSRFGLNNPGVYLELKFREGIEPQSVTVLLAKADKGEKVEGGVYAASSGTDTVFKVATDSPAGVSKFDALLKGVDDFRYKRIVDASESEIDRVVATTVGSDPVTIVSSGVSWTVNGKESDPVFVQQLLQDISSLKAVSFPVSVPTDAFNAPFLILEITKKAQGLVAASNKPVLTVTVGAEFKSESGDALRYVKTSLDETVYAVRDVEAKRILPHEENLVPTPTAAPSTPSSSVPNASVPKAD
jgi:hypothetical protein